MQQWLRAAAAAQTSSPAAFQRHTTGAGRQHAIATLSRGINSHTPVSATGVHPIKHLSQSGAGREGAAQAVTIAQPDLQLDLRWRGPHRRCSGCGSRGSSSRRCSRGLVLRRCPRLLRRRCPGLLLLRWRRPLSLCHCCRICCHRFQLSCWLWLRWRRLRRLVALGSVWDDLQGGTRLDACLCQRQALCRCTRHHPRLRLNQQVGQRAGAARRTCFVHLQAGGTR